MAELKCPFCGSDLCGCIGHPYCRNEKCVMCDDPMPQELLDLLEDTKKKLDIAVETIRDVKNDPDTNQETTDYLAYRLEQINNKEQQ